MVFKDDIVGKVIELNAARDRKQLSAQKKRDFFILSLEDELNNNDAIIAESFKATEIDIKLTRAMYSGDADELRKLEIEISSIEAMKIERTLANG